MTAIDPHRRTSNHGSSLNAGILGVGWLVLFTWSGWSSATDVPMPEFTQKEQSAWFNSPPLTSADLRGRVVLIDVWTYSCHNCYRSIPWLLDLEREFDPYPFTIVGIHSPEFRAERDSGNVARKIKEFKITHPVMMDNDFAYWRKLENRYWPSFYLVDRRGVIRARYYGETRVGTRRDQRIRAAIQFLLEEGMDERAPGTEKRP